MYLAGIDLGTTGCKCMVFDYSGNIAGSHYIEYDLIFNSEGVEQDAELWWEHAKTALREAVRSAGIKGSDIKGIAVSSQGIASVPVSRGGKPLAHAISWYDTRAWEEAEEMEGRYGADFFLENSGRVPGPLFFPQVLHLKRHKKDIYEKAGFFLMAQDYLVYRFCGEALTDYSMASGTLSFDTGKHEWLEHLFEQYGIEKTKFPALRPFGSSAGKLLPQAAQELGLSDDTIVAVGMQDQKAAALGAGITTEPGIMTLSLGTASAISQLSSKKIIDRIDRKGRVFCHSFDGRRWIMENYVGASGSCLKWLRDALFPALSYAGLDCLAQKSNPGSGAVIFTPELGEGHGSFSGLSLNSQTGDLVRAVLEGIAYGVRRCVEIQIELSPGMRELRVFGGGAGSALWCQILADVLAMPVAVPRTKECSNLGAAVCAGLALGLFPDDKALAEFTGRVSRRYEPNPGNVRIYNEGYGKFLMTR